MFINELIETPWIPMAPLLHRQGPRQWCPGAQSCDHGLLQEVLEPLGTQKNPVN